MSWNNRVAVLGDITGDIYYDVLQISNQPVPFLRVYMMINATREAKEVKGLRIVFYGVLAELAKHTCKLAAASWCRDTSNCAKEKTTRLSPK